MIYQLLEDAADMQFKPNTLVGAKPLEAYDELRQCLAPYLPNIGHRLRYARSMHTLVGLLKIGAIVSLSKGRVGKACLFAGACATASMEERCFIIFRPHIQTSGGGWSQCTWLDVAPAEDVEHNLPYSVEGNVLFPIFPRHGI